MLWWPTPQSVPSCQPKFPFTRPLSVWLLYQMHAGGPGPADTHGNYWLIRKNKCLAQIQNFLCWIVPSADYKDNLVLGKSYDFVSHLNPVANARGLVSVDASFTIQRATKHSPSYVSLPGDNHPSIARWMENQRAICGSCDSFHSPRCTKAIRDQLMTVIEEGLGGSGRFPRLIDEPGLSFSSQPFQF